MPNHITTAVEIMGPKDVLSKLIKDTKIKLEKDVENEFDFNGIIPMPEELQIESGSQTDLGMMAHSQWRYEVDCSSTMPWWSERYPGVTNAAELKAFLENSGKDEDKEALKAGKQALDNLEKYNHKDWYSWSNAMWGTKWNAYDVHYLEHDDNHLILDITTAWDTPRGIWNAIEERGLQVNGMVYGEVEGIETLGDGGPFYQNISVDYEGDFSNYEGDA